MLTKKWLFSERKYVCLLTVFLFALISIYRHSMTAKTVPDNSVTDFRSKIATDTSINSAEEISKNGGTELSNYTITDTKRNAVNKTTWEIIVTVNSGYMDFFLNWYISFKNFNFNVSVNVITEDDDSYEILKRYQNNKMRVMHSESISIQNASNFNTRNFGLLVKRRPKHILRFLSLGVNVLYVDIDTVWLKNPFPYFEGNFDIGLAERGKPHEYNSGLIAIRSNAVSKTLVRMWANAVRADRHNYNQPGLKRVLAKLKKKVKLLVLDSRKFPTGCMVFGHSSDKAIIPDDVVIVHNNCIVGHKKKLQRFVNNGLWYIKTDGKGETLDSGTIEQILK